MAKKRKASRAPVAKGPKEVDAADARLGPITTYADVADSEDEHFLKEDEIMFDEEPKSKRQRRLEEEAEFFDDSDEEVLGGGDDDSDADSIIAAVKQKQPKKKKRKKGVADSDDDEEEEKQPEDEEDGNWWGSSKQEYYDADKIETEADALEEEAEAKRLQKKKLSKMTEEDFIFDQDEWLQAEPPEDKGEVVTEVLGDVEIPEDMSAEERYKLLTTRYPEFEHLVNEFQELQPQLAALQKAAEGQPAQSVAAVKYWILGCYVAALASYFALLTSPARDNAGSQKTMDPAELRDHEIMGTLVTCKNQWNRVKDLQESIRDASPEAESDAEEMDLGAEDMEAADSESEVEKPKVKAPKKSKKKAAPATKSSEDVEKSLADLYDLPLATKKAKKSKGAKAAAAANDSDSDFGEEESLNAAEAAEKAQRKKSLRFYTSQIVQKANKRAGAGRDAGGDMDIPYRERLKDRQARLNLEAERRGKKHGEDLDAGADDSNDEDANTAAAMRDDEDDYYDMVAAASTKKKTEKADRKAALAAASKADRVVPVEEIGEDGKRKITYAIDKNKGLTPKRKKENRNPRVKKRKAYDSKMKKLGSMKPTFKGNAPGPYAGEQSGIKAGLIRSTKF